MRLNIFTLILTSLFFTGCTSFFSAINYSPSKKVHAISFQTNDNRPTYKFNYPDTAGNTYLRELRHGYGLDTLIANQPDEIERIKTILQWSSSQWEHNGSNSPSNADALTILKEAAQGQQFRCVEYGILAATSLNAVGIHARVLGLKTKDVEKVKLGAAHVVAETYSHQFDKWIFIDTQLNIMPTLQGIPLNAVEFQKAILTEKEHIELVNSAGKVESDFSKSYLDWIGKYLYFFDVNFDQRAGYQIELKKQDGKPKLMLVPLEAENPTVFQRNWKINYCVYTHTINDFYCSPID